MTAHSAKAELMGDDGRATAYFWRVLVSLAPKGVLPTAQAVLFDATGAATPLFQKILPQISPVGSAVPKATTPLVDVRTGQATPIFQKFMGIAI